mgnify:CR=1 FL=1|jgi:hypothetical protein
MQFTIKFTDEGKSNFDALTGDQAKAGVLGQVRKALGFLQTNPRHPSLNTHKYTAMKGPNGEDVWESYAQNNSSGAYRIFFCYGPNVLKKDQKKKQKRKVAEHIITIIAITPHP